MFGTENSKVERTMKTSSDAEQFALGRVDLGKMAWMALMLTPGMGPTRIWKAMGRLGEAERLFDASLTELEGLGMPAPSAQFVFEGKARAAAEDEMKRVAEAGGLVLTPEDDAYPERLREIYDPPAVLWIRGDVRLLARPGIAVVGTRQPSPYGAGMAELLSRDLANRRLVILSGMARGVDTAAHKGAIEAGGKDRGGMGYGDRRDLSEGEQEAGGADCGHRRDDCERVSAGDVSGAAELPDSEPDFERDECWGAGDRGGGVQRDENYGAVRDGAESGRFCGSGERHQQERLGP